MTIYGYVDSKQQHPRGNIRYVAYKQQWAIILERFKICVQDKDMINFANDPVLCQKEPTKQ